MIMAASAVNALTVAATVNVVANAAAAHPAPPTSLTQTSRLYRNVDASPIACVSRRILNYSSSTIYRSTGPQISKDPPSHSTYKAPYLDATCALCGGLVIYLKNHMEYLIFGTVFRYLQ